MEIKEIDNLAKLCRIEFSDDEKKELIKEMDSVLSFVAQIQEVKTDSLKPQANILRNVMREDGNPHESEEYTAVILAEAPKTEKDYFKVKKIL